MRMNDWRARGAYHTLQGRAIFTIDTDPDNAHNKPALAILHGYPTSSHDYAGVLDALAAHYRVIVHDHLGFGLSDKPRDYAYSVLEQADIALALWRKLGVRSAHVFAHDYGTSLGTELLARWNLGFRPVHIRSLTLCNGSVHIELAKLRVIQKLLRSTTLGPLVARLSTQAVFNRNMRRIWHDPTALAQDDLDTMWALLTRAEGKAVLPRITHYLYDRERFWHRWVGALQNSALPLGFVWGAEDPITGVDVAQVHHAESPGSALTVLDGVGHYPMLEAPERWTEALLDQLGRIGEARGC